MALIIRAPSALTAPLAGTPVIPDISSNLLWTLDAASLALANGAAVDTWVAAGIAPLVDRTFSVQYPGWSKPTLSLSGGPGGHPAVLFNGAQQIANAAAGATQEAQPLTFAFMCKADAYAETQARILTAGNQIIGPGSTGYYASNAGQARLSSASSPAGWAPLIVVFNGTASKIKSGTAAIVTGNTGTAVNNRNTLGGQEAVFSGVGLVGGIAYAKCFNRALTDVDIEALALQLRRQFGLA